MWFAVAAGIKVPSSLNNIYKELAEDVGTTKPNNGCLKKVTNKLGPLLSRYQAFRVCLGLLQFSCGQGHNGQNSYQLPPYQHVMRDIWLLYHSDLYSESWQDCVCPLSQLAA